MAQELDPSVMHPNFPELLKKYEICEDAFCGDVTEYVEVLDGQTKDERKLYVNRAAYFGVVQPTVSSLVGALTRRRFEMQGTFPQTDFTSPDEFLQMNFKNILLGARTVLYVTVQDGASKIVAYDCDDVINWADDFIVIKEYETVRDSKNPFKVMSQPYYRELYLDDDGMFRSRKWMKTNKGRWVFEDLEDLVINGSLIDYIPAFVATPYDTSWEVFTPPLYTQSGLNIQHFKQYCDLAHYAHFMALPTPYITGDLATYQQNDGTTINAQVKLGSTKEVLHLDKEAQCGYMEVSGASFKMLQDELKNIEERMYIAGSKLMTNKNGVESAAALNIRASGETATLETIATSLESAMNGALELCSLIDREQKSITLNRDFSQVVLDPAQVKVLLEAYAAGTVTLEQVQQQLERGEIVSPQEMST